MSAVAEQLLLFAAFYGSVAVAVTTWVVRRLCRRRRMVRNGQAVTQRLPKFQEPAKSALLIVAGDYDEYQHYCARRRLNRYHEAVFVQYAAVVRERPGSRYVVIGSARQLPNIDAIVSSLTYAGCRPE